MYKEYRVHPLMILKFVKPMLFILLLPFVKAILQYIVKDEVIGVLGVEIILGCAIVILSYARCCSYRIICTPESLIIKKGFLFKQTADIPLNKLSSVQSVVTPFDMLFKTLTYRINTEAGFKNQSDFEFKLRLKDGRELSSILYGKEEFIRQRFSAFRVAIMAATTSSAFTGLVLVVPIINKAGDLLGVALRDMLLDEINNVSERIKSFFPPIVNTVTLIFLISYLIAFLYSFFKYINFRLRLSEEKLEVRSGFYERIRTSFKKSSVNNVIVEQSPIMHLIKQFSMKVSVGGFGEGKGESQMVVPCGSRKEINQDFEAYFPFLVVEGDGIKPLKDKITQARFLFLPSILLLAVLGLSFVLALLFKDFGKLILFLSVVLQCMVFYFAYLSLFERKNGKIILGNTVFIKSIRPFRTRELYCPKENIGQITVRQFPMDRKYNTCSVRVTVRSESADSIKLRLINFTEIRNTLNKCFCIEE